jgi:murein L,D-transpeptidase YafK
MVEGVVMAWKWGQNLIGNLSDEQFAKDKARIAEERKLRMLAIKDNAVALSKATTAAQSALEWKLAFKTEDDQLFEDRYGEVGGGRPKINPREEERILRERYEEVQKMNMAIDVNTNTGQADVRTKGFPDFISVKTSSTMGY